ncbi:MAG: hypothetical protein P8M78_08475 [Myxococcota bacterium]|nr:hypothetical protein [Myxococcota bacterium]
MIQSDLSEASLEVFRHLNRRGHRAWMTGESLAEQMLGRPPAFVSLQTTATSAEIRDLFGQAVPTHPRGRVWQVPTLSGPVDCQPCEESDPLNTLLACRGLTSFGMAWFPLDETLKDPFGGYSDLTAGRLRLIQPNASPLARNPLLILSLLNRVARWGEDPDPDCQRALSTVNREDWESIPSPWRGAALKKIFESAQPARVVRLLADTGLEKALGVLSHPGTAPLVEQCTDDPLLGLSIWLRGNRPGRFLRRHRFDRVGGQRIVRLLSAHPLEENFSARRRSSLLRLAALPALDREALFWLRENELESAPASDEIRLTQKRLADLRAGLEDYFKREATAQKSPALALDGRGIMAALGIESGPNVGQAIEYLKREVQANPELNQPATLRSLLASWHPDSLPQSPSNAHGT